jgi:YVTN family beta-propeller protein
LVLRLHTLVIGLGLGLVGPLSAGTLVVVHRTDATLHLLDPISGARLAELPTGRAPHEVAVDGTGRIAVVSNHGTRDEAGSSLTVVDVRKAQVLRTIDLDTHRKPHGLAWLSGDVVAVTSEGTAHLVLVNVTTGEVVGAIETKQRGSHMVVATADGKRAFVTNVQSGTVSVLDVASGRKLRDIPTGRGAEGIAMTPDGKEVWVCNRAADTLSVIDTGTLEVLSTLPCPGSPLRVAIASDGASALVALPRTREIARFDVAGRTELSRRKLDLGAAGEGSVPVGLLISPDGATTWVTATGADVVAVVDTTTLEVSRLLAAGKDADGLAYARAVPEFVPRTPAH